jgi:hypothetical protein
MLLGIGGRHGKSILKQNQPDRFMEGLLDEKEQFTPAAVPDGDLQQTGHLAQLRLILIAPIAQ